MKNKNTRRNNRTIYLAGLLLFTLTACINEDNFSTKVEPVRQGDLFEVIKEKDSLLFDIGFNQIDTAQVARLISEDFTFYHDEHGITQGKADFLKDIHSISGLPFKTWRVLDEKSLEVFLMHKENGKVLYAAIQNGMHSFYQQKEGEKANKTSTARFSHLWILEHGQWKLKNAFSYNHLAP